MPLDQDIEGSHSEREPGVKILPHAVHDFPHSSGFSGAEAQAHIDSPPRSGFAG
jgi:hypothetical protein